MRVSPLAPHFLPYIRCQEGLCNGLSCFRNLTLSRSRVKLIRAGSFASRAAKRIRRIWGAIHGSRAGRSTRRLDLPLPVSGTGLASHVSLAHHTVTEVLAVRVVGRKTLWRNTLSPSYGSTTRPAITALSLQSPTYENFLRKPHKLH